MTRTRREPRRVQRARRAAAFHTDRARRASTLSAQFRATADALVSAAKHTRTRGVARDLRQEVTEHVHHALDAGAASENSRALYEQKLTAAGSDVQRLGTALMCLHGAINRLTATERDRLFGHYIQHFQAETGRINTTGGVR